MDVCLQISFQTAVPATQLVDRLARVNEALGSILKTL